MPTRLTSFLRFCAAILVTGSGAAHIASLWFRELDEQAVVALLLGAVYVILGIGVFGQSRFSLFLAMVLPATVAFTTSIAAITLSPLQSASVAADILVVTLSGIVLWQLSHRASD